MPVFPGCQTGPVSGGHSPHFAVRRVLPPVLHQISVNERGSNPPVLCARRRIASAQNRRDPTIPTATPTFYAGVWGANLVQDLQAVQHMNRFERWIRRNPEQATPLIVAAVMIVAAVVVVLTVASLA